MPWRAEKTMYQNPQDETRGGSTTEIWEVYPVTDDGITYDPNGFVVAEKILEPGAVIGLPTRGSAHATAGFGVCLGRRVSQVVSRTSVLVLVFYRSYGIYTGLPQSASQGDAGETERVIRPVWNAFVISNTTGPGFTRYTENDSSIWTRQHFQRVETRTQAGSQVGLVLNAIYDNAGNWYFIDDRYYILSGKSSAEYTGGTTTKIRYIFESWQAHPLIAANNASFKNAVAIPAINGLEIWHSGIDPVTQIPFVVAVPRDQFCGQGGALPGYP